MKNQNPGYVSYADGIDWASVFTTVVNTGTSILTQTQAQKTAAANADASNAAAKATQASQAAQQQALLDKIAMLNTPTAQKANNSKTILYASIAAALVIVIVVVILIVKRR